MENRNWAYLLKYASPRSILVVTWENRLLELKCPFKAEVIERVGDLKSGEVVSVDLVKISTSLITVFIVAGEPYYYHHFHIMIG